MPAERLTLAWAIELGARRSELMPFAYESLGRIRSHPQGVRQSSICKRNIYFPTGNIVDLHVGFDRFLV